jgi:hypothetical protein
MVAIPDVNPIETAIEGHQIKVKKRPYLGMSQVGHECYNYLWLSFRWAYTEYITPRTQRIFDRGDLEEPRIIHDLKNIGAEVYMLKDGNKIPATGKRGEYQEEIVHFTGHSKGHIDSRIINLPGCEKTEHLGEYKTMKEQYFKQLLKVGLEDYSTVYWGQIQLYMGYLGLKRTLFIATNKNTEERVYLRYHFDKKQFDFLKQKILDIITSDKPMYKISKKIDFYKCRMCSAKNVCFKLIPPDKNCHTCKFGTIEDKGEWSCGHTSDAIRIPENVQRKGCKLYERLF